MASTKRWLSGLILCFSALAMSGCCLFGQCEEEPQEAKAKSGDVQYTDETFTVLLLVPTKQYNAEGEVTGRYDQHIADHAAYMASVKKSGDENPRDPTNLIRGGVFFGGNGAMYLFKGTLPGEVWKISAKDPMVKAGYYEPRVREWRSYFSTIEKEADEQALYYVRYSQKGPMWQDRETLSRQPGLQDHIAFLGEKMSDGSVTLAGPFVDELSGGMTVFRANTQEDYEAMHAEDPWTKTNMYTSKHFRWLVSLK